MKNRFSKIFILAFCTICAGLFSACSFSPAKEQIMVPSITVNEGLNGQKVVVLSEVEHASSYTIRIDGADCDTYNTYLDCTDLLSDAKVYTLSARANAVEGYISSEFSDTIQYSAGTTLGSPVVKVYDKVISWTHDISASNYTVTITTPNDQVITKTTAANRYDFSQYVDEAGVYTFSVVANSSKLYVSSSEPSTAVTYTHTKTHSTPFNLIVNEIDNNVWLSFVDEDNAGDYTVKIDNSTYDIKDNNEIRLSDYHNFNEAKRYYISVKADNQPDQHYTESAYSQETYFDKYVQLDTPIDLAISDNNDQVLLSWSAVNNARTYSVYLNESSDAYVEKVSATQISLPKTMLDNGQLSFQVEADGFDHYLSSHISNAEYFQSVDMLATPSGLNIETVGNNVILSWSAVAGASQYAIEIDNEIVDVTVGTSYTLNSHFDNAGTYTMRVRALSNTASQVDSNFSGTMRYTYVVKLNKPSGLAVSSENNRYYLSFNANNTNAHSYNIYINNTLAKIDVTTTTVEITSLFTSVGEYNISVQAVASAATLYRDSDKSVSYAFTYKTALAMPSNVKVDEVNKLLTWDKVPNASGYEIYINSTRFESTTNSFNISAYYVNAGEYVFKVTALAAANSYYLSSEPNTITKVHNITLNAPTDLEVYYDSEGKLWIEFTFDSKASHYLVYITQDLNSFVNTIATTSPFEITDSLSGAGLFTIYVQAIGEGYYVNSTMSNMVQIQKDITLDAPTVSSVRKSSDSESIMVNFNGNVNAASYNARVNGIEITGITTTSFDINDYVDFEGDYAIQLQAVGKGAYTNSEYGKVHTYKHTFTTMYDYKGCDVFMYGEDIDFYIDSFQEFKLAVWYNYLYRIEDYTLYLPNGYTTIANSLKSEYGDYFGINYVDLDYIDIFMYTLYAYPEYVSTVDGLIYGASYGNNVYGCSYTDAMKFNHNDTFVADDIANKYNAADIYVYKQTTFNAVNNPYQGINYVDSRSQTYDSFAINSRDSVPVSNTEQLLMAVTYGKKPAFTGNSTVAETVYNNAKSVLRRIVKDDFTDYQKVLAIYDWLTIHTVYDYDIIQFTNATGDGDIDTIGQYKDFYLEGVLYDLNNSLAVCDGIAKAFTLLCQIEGINAYKCNGMAGAQGNTANWGGHAWNKVYLGGNWYVVDSTWDDAILDTSALTGKNDYVLTATHEYFLRPDSFIDLTHEEEYPRKYFTGTHEYGYTVGDKYEYGYHGMTTISHNSKSFDLVIGNAKLDAEGNEIYDYDSVLSELTQLFAYAKANETNSVVEFRLSDGYMEHFASNIYASSSFTTLISSAMQGAGVSSYVRHTGYSSTNNFHCITIKA